MQRVTVGIRHHVGMAAVLGNLMRSTVRPEAAFVMPPDQDPCERGQLLHCRRYGWDVSNFSRGSAMALEVPVSTTRLPATGKAEGGLIDEAP